jgi:hypothetical protein
LTPGNVTHQEAKDRYEKGYILFNAESVLRGLTEIQQELCGLPHEQNAAKRQTRSANKNEPSS